MAKIAPFGGRYSPHGEQGETDRAIAEVEGVKAEPTSRLSRIGDPLHARRALLPGPNGIG